MPEADPLALPVGMCVGPWRVLGWGGRGSYGTIYRVERVGREWEGTFALKLAVHPGDERFPREAWLLSRIRGPHVPRLYDEGVWQHRHGAYPYLVMEWIEGESLYDWSARHNPSLSQMLEKLVQVARALEATHAAGGVHRDVKGDNVRVRVDGHVLLMDFGAGHYRGAATLTRQLLPPSTPAYRSPEAWAFVRVFSRHPTAHYPASASDDLFALGVMAYRLVTDEYPPMTSPEEPGAEVWSEGGPGPRPPRELNPRVGPELDAIILRLLAVAPIERFGGRARVAAEAMERATQSVGPGGDVPMFDWGEAHVPRVRSLADVRMAEEWDAGERKEFERRQEQVRTRSARVLEQFWPGAFTRAWRGGVAVACLAVLVLLAVSGALRAWEALRAALGLESGRGGRVAVGDSAELSSAAPSEPESQKGSVSQPGEPVPEKPLPGQRRPPCRQKGEVEIRGGCWTRIGDVQPPCADYAYEWNGACYLPVTPKRRQPAAAPP